MCGGTRCCLIHSGERGERGRGEGEEVSGGYMEVVITHDSCIEKTCEVYTRYEFLPPIFLEGSHL